MNVLYLMTEPFGYGGVQSDMLALGEDLTARGHSVTVATSEGVLLPELLDKGARFADINFHFSSPIGFLRSARALRQFIRDHKIDVLAPQSVRTTMVSYFALRIWPFSYRLESNNKPCPIVTTIHNIHNPVHFRYAGHILQRCADFTIFESHYERNRLLASGLAANKSAVVHSGIDTDKFTPQPVDQTLLARLNLDKSVHKIFAIVARLSEEKGHDLLLQAFSRLLQEEPNARLLIIGDGPLEKPLHQLHKELKLEEQVIFTGAQRNIPDYLSIIDVFVLSSTRESFPLAAREAMAAGRAVIAPRIGGCGEVVDDENTGLLFQAGNIDDLAEKMNQILGNNMFDSYGQNARQRVVDLFSRKQWIEGDEKVYRRFSGSEKSPEADQTVSPD